MIIERMRGEGRKLVIVPDRFVVSAERKILGVLGLKGSFDIEVLSFARLAQRLLAKKHVRCLTPEGAVLLMRKVINENAGELKAFRGAAKNFGFAKELFAALTAIRNNGITVGALKSAEESLPTYIKDKTADIALLYGEYLKGLKDDYDGTSRREALAREIEESEYIAESDVFVTEYFSMSKLELNIVEKLIKCAKSFTIALLEPNDYPSARLYPSKFVDALLQIASKYGKVTRISSQEKLSPAKQAIEKYLYSYEPVEGIPSGGNIRIRLCESREEEAEALAGDIRLAVMGGARYMDIAVVAGEPEEYVPVIERVFRRFGIPFFADKSVKLTKTPLIRAITDFWKTKLDGAKLTDVLKFVGNPMFGETGRAEALENYCLKYNVAVVGVNSPFRIEDDLLPEAEEAREFFASFSCDVPKSAETRVFTAAVRKFCEDYDLFAKSEAFAAECADDREHAEIMKQVPSILGELLDETDEMLGGKTFSREDFFTLMTSMLDSYEVKNIPLYFDCVYVGECSKSRYLDIKHLFVIGASEGAIPAETDNSGIISEREIEALKKLKVIIEPGAVASNLENKLHLQQLLIKPTESLTISYPGTAGGAEKRPSSVIRELTEIFSDLETVKYSDEETSDYRRFVRCAATKRQAMHSLSGQITRYLSGEETDLKLSDALFAASSECGLNPLNELLPREADLGGRSELFFPKNKTKVSQLESYFRCPFSHFLSYGLKLKERKEGIKAVDTGNFLHKVLENYVLSIGDFTADDAAAEGAADEAIEAALALPEFAALNEDSMKVLKGRLVSEAKSTLGRMHEAGRHSRFQPVYVEKTFGITDEPIEFGGCSVKMSGKIDRVDAYDGYVAVVDYKTGKVESSLREVYCGKKIQLYVYLYALKKNFGYKPFGAFYYSVDNDYKRENKRPLSGQYLGKENMMRKFDDTLRETDGCGYAEYLPYDTGRTGPNAETRRAMLSEEEFDGIFGYVGELVGKLCEEIRDGYIAKSPFEDGCRYCKYRSICGGSEGEREVPKADIGTITEATNGGKVD